MSSSAGSPDFNDLVRERMNLTPYLASIGGEMIELSEARARVRLPYGPHLVGDPRTGVVHGGVVTGILDHTAGMAVFGKLRRPVPIATLDLRIDYMKPATLGEAIVADVTCLKVTHDIAFVRGAAYHADPADAIALCTGAFILIRGGVSPGIP
ncbi:MAG TPA: PaaI family thioesterase [Rhizomicrobium sp.]|nr:PaaI family thioesterase [Rhizomicrobium sp.]